MTHLAGFIYLHLFCLTNHLEFEVCVPHDSIDVRQDSVEGETHISTQIRVILVGMLRM